MYNADGTTNQAGKITHVVRLRLSIQDHTEVTTFAVTNTGNSDVIIGFDWLRHHNPSVNWTKGKIIFDRCPLECKRKRLAAIWAEEDDEDLELGDRIFMTQMRPDAEVEERIRAMGSIATQLAAANATAEGKRTIEELVPSEYLEEYRKVFDKGE